jgi:transcriptional regulator with XRE-family HTH domain
MRINQQAALPPDLIGEARNLGNLLARLRIARGVRQTDAALRAGLSRNTVYRLEKGDPGVATGQVLRYLDAIAPGKTLLELLQQSDPSLADLALREKRQRARSLSEKEKKKLDF